MPEIWQLTAAQFVGCWPVVDPGSASEAAADEAQLEREIEEDCRFWLRSSLRRCPVETFSIADVLGGEAVVLLHADPEGGYEVCGGYSGPSLWVARGCRRRGLAAELVLARAEREGGALSPLSYTSAGLAAHMSAHKLAVARAIQQGYRVPQHIVAHYGQSLARLDDGRADLKAVTPPGLAVPGRTVCANRGQHRASQASST